MKFKPGTLVEIYRTIDVDPKGIAVQTLDPIYIDKLALVVDYYATSNYYLILPVGEEAPLQVYEKEIRIVND